MVASLQASEKGLREIDCQRKLKGWTKYEQAWCDQALTSTATLKRFWQGKPISHESFVGICEVVGIENWQKIVNMLEETSSDEAEVSASDSPQNINIAQNAPNNSGLVIGNVQGNVNN